LSDDPRHGSASVPDDIPQHLEQQIDIGGRDGRISAETRSVLRELLLQLHADLERRERIEGHFTRRLRWSLLLLGLVALLAAGLMFRLIDQMDSHMHVMSLQMKQMTASVSAMENAVGVIGADTHRIVDGLVQIRAGMADIDRHMASLPAMQQDVAHMSGAVSVMSGEIGALRAEVDGIAGSTAVMQRPFRFMDGFLP
jgi:hypothetical protein